MSKTTRLSDAQKNILTIFYSKPKLKTTIKRADRKVIWDDFVVNRNIKPYGFLEKEVPAFFSELNKAISVGKNLQPAVFSECVYAQSLAHQFSLSKFTNMSETKGLNFHNDTLKKIKSTGLSVRYCYSNSDESNLLFQAGGAGSVDCALISQIEKFNGATWSTVGSMPFPLWYNESVVYNNFIYVLGGVNSSSATVRNVYKYDGNVTWIGSPSMIDTRFGHGAGVLNNNIYVT
jgi:hypothetical protein